MRIALVSDWFLPRRGGIELHLADLAARLAAAGHQVDVLTPLAAGAAPSDAHGDPGLPDGVRVRRLDVRRLPGAGIAYTPALWRTLEHACGGPRYDVVHAHASVVAPAAWAGMAAARRHGIPCVVTFHSTLHASARLLGLADDALGWAQGAVLATGVSSVVAAQLATRVPRARVAVLPNATDVAWWRDAPDAAARRAAAALVPPRAPGEVRLLAVMRLSRKKRPLVLPRVLAAAIAAGRRVRLVVAGDGAEAGALVAAARRAGVADALSVAGWQPRAVLRALHADADLFVLPTAEESFGIAALEARAAGVPVLGRAGTGLVDFVRDGIDGVLAGSDDALVAAAARLAVDDAARTRLAALGRLTPPTAFAWEAVIAEHLACYRAAGEALAHPASTGASATWPASAAVGGQRAARAGARRAGVGRAR